MMKASYRAPDKALFSPKSIAVFHMNVYAVGIH